MLQVAPRADPGDADMTTPPGTITAPASSVQEQLDPILQRIRAGNCKLEYAEADLLLRKRAQQPDRRTEPEERQPPWAPPPQPAFVACHLWQGWLQRHFKHGL